MIALIALLGLYSIAVTIVGYILYLEKRQLQDLNESRTQRMLDAEQRAMRLERIMKRVMKRNSTRITINATEKEKVLTPS